MVPKHMTRQLFLAGALVSASAVLGFAVPALAQVAYFPDGERIHPFGGIYDESYGTSRTFEILPGPYGGPPTVRVGVRCQYPHGWNVTDFSRDVNGTPAGLDHTCPGAAGPGIRLRSRY